MARPTVLYDWAKDTYLDEVYNVSNKIAPPIEFQSSGVLREQPVPAQYLNSYLNNMNEWIRYLDQETQAGIGVYVPITRRVNGKQLNTDITLSYSDVGAVPISRRVNNKQLNTDITLTSSDVGAVPNNNTYTITLGGDLNGSATFSTNSVNITATVQDYSHLHNVSNISGLQDKLDEKLGKFEEAASALSAKLLLPAKTINGTTFDNSTSITTSYWGATRTFTIGASAKNLNGASNVSWSLSEIGAASDNHTHNTTSVSQTVLYNKTGGLEKGNFTLSQPYNNFDEILVFGSDDASSRIVCTRHTPETIALGEGINTSKGYAIHHGVGVGGWFGVFSADKKTFNTRTENSRIHKIIGIKYIYGG